MEPNREWSDRSILKPLKNPSEKPYEITMETSEITFLGVKNQPDFAKTEINMRPGKSIVELRSLKFYFQDFRNRVISYERLINVIFDDLEAVYEPEWLEVVIVTNPRGGISSRLKIDSKMRGDQ